MCLFQIERHADKRVHCGGVFLAELGRMGAKVGEKANWGVDTRLRQLNSIQRSHPRVRLRRRWIA